ncbi:MmcQ/YjbR family DNA-binding protein [Caulobacter hibisci]|uniref:MmcQ/YjbR family DNA-binding protein n=1 Tax=Caulobacter hibisci TaxID=2035993 RepID=A0ABS0T4M0_9CAUL|nr:MmcQ/YjbR family DNA-binding protein [Caulobacter hibisci]MBI1686802.1 MmcQ/YjbR family DNA-binding protein [Caulobacter hibisci]
MTPEAFTRLAHRLSPTVKAHPILETVQFHVGGKAFATLGWPEAGWAVVKLSARDQQRILAAHEAASPEPGRQRRSGVTLLWLEDLEEAALADVLAAAWKQAYSGERTPRRGGRPRKGAAPAGLASSQS